MQQEAMEKALWDYIDGTCTADEAAGIQALVQADATWKQAYEELLEVQAFAAQASLPEEPSMRFTKNVMEALAAVAPVRKYINQWVVKGIAAFFVLAIGISLVAMVMQVDLSIAMPVEETTKSYKLPAMSQHVIGEMLRNILVPVTILLFLLLADEWRRRNLLDNVNK